LSYTWDWNDHWEWIDILDLDYDQLLREIRLERTENVVARTDPLPGGILRRLLLPWDYYQIPTQKGAEEPGDSENQERAG